MPAPSFVAFRLRYGWCCVRLGVTCSHHVRGRHVHARKDEEKSEVVEIYVSPLPTRYEAGEMMKERCTHCSRESWHDEGERGKKEVLASILA